MLILNVRLQMLVTQVFGLWPYFYVARLKSYQTTWCLKCYPVCIMMMILFGIIRSTNLTFEYTSPIFKTESANLVRHSITIAILVVFVTSYLIQFNNYGQIEHFITRAWLFSSNINKTLGAARWPQCSGLVWLFFLKTIFITIMIVCAEYQKHNAGIVSADRNSLNGFVVIAHSIITCIIPNWFYGGMLVAYFCFRLLNIQLMAIRDLAIEAVKTQHGRMRHFCALSDKLDELAILHMELCYLTKFFNRLFNLQICIWIWHRASFVMVQMFFGFIVTSTWVRNASTDGGRLVKTFWFGAAEVYVQAIDMILLIYICNYTGIEVNNRFVYIWWLCKELN